MRKIVEVEQRHEAREREGAAVGMQLRRRRSLGKKFPWAGEGG
jgi:hypothetical protein